MSLGIRLRQARKRAGMTQQEIGSKIRNLTGQAIARWESGHTHPDPEDLGVFCRITGANLFWLVYGEEPNGARPESVGVQGRVVPKLLWDQLIARVDGLLTVPSEEFIRTHFDCGERSFATVVHDKSNEPEIQPGDSVVIDPDAAPKPGDLVLVRHNNGVILRKVRMREAHIELVPAHIDWPTVTVATLDASNLIGVVTEHARPRRR